jgi:hypothetical protein
MDFVAAEFADIATSTNLVANRSFESGDDKGPYFNFTLAGPRPLALWEEIWRRLYDNAEVGPGMRRASMAVCSDEAGWHDYLQLYHFNPSVQLDSTSELQD